MNTKSDKAEIKPLLCDTNGYHKGCTAEDIKRDFCSHLKYTLAKSEITATLHDKRVALALTVRDRLIERWMQTSKTYYDQNVKRVYYLSMEYLIGRALGNNVINLGMENQVHEAMDQMGLDWNAMREEAWDAGLGNGGLGRLAACFLDAMATLQLPGVGYGVRYDYGIFRQLIRDGYQVEEPDNWLRHGDPWEIERPEYQTDVHFGGKVIDDRDENGAYLCRWVDYETVVGVPYDFPIPGYQNNTVNNLRLWTAKATEEFHLEFFNNGDYIKAYEQKMHSENITKVLYPNDNIVEGRSLRFRQEYFFVSCSIQDIIRRFKMNNDDVRHLHKKVAIQLNDTHPAIAIPEMMRLLLDQHKLSWDEAWGVTVQTFGYTNHTLMPEAMERWPVRFFEKMLPRHLKIIYEINRRFLRDVMTRFSHDQDRVARMSLIEEGPERQIHMGHLAVVGSHSVNGVSALHSRLVEETVFRDFYEMDPHKFNNKTNGITPRRWLLKCNPGLASLITERIGDAWVTNLDELKRLIPCADDPEFLAALQRVKRENKVRLADHIRDTMGIVVHPDSLFDTQIKRLHEYKRQLLNMLHVLHQYFRMRDNPGLGYQPRTFLFAGKAAPGYTMAKLIIKFINDAAGIINRDPEVNGRMNVVFLPDYRVSLAEKIIPATDLSEQISTAGMEASGTGNMKFALNGALTIGTLDGANIEIREEVGADNFFLFGKTADEVEDARRQATYDPYEIYHADPVLKDVLDCMEHDFFNLDEPGIFRPLKRSLLDDGDKYFVLADFHDYMRAQEAVNGAYGDADQWARMCALNIANIGKFSADRTINEYSREIWGTKACPVDMPTA